MIELYAMALNENGKCEISVFHWGQGRDEDFVFDGIPITHRRRAAFTSECPPPTFTLSMKAAKKLAREILEMGE